MKVPPGQLPTGILSSRIITPDSFLPGQLLSGQLLPIKNIPGQFPTRLLPSGQLPLNNSHWRTAPLITALYEIHPKTLIPRTFALRMITPE